ncbi:MAG TPA: type II secretion system protein [Patescibacteria group bacterium]|nr:type II secretion system protein [Patescibacteria group bacterium]
MPNYKTLKGFTVIELMVSIGILAILFALTTINLGRLPSTTSQSAAIDTLISDIRGQQTQAMAGRTAYGIHFDANSYTLTPSNFVINLDPGLSFDNSGQNLTFAAGSGETTPMTFSVINSQVNKTTVININKYGASY